MVRRKSFPSSPRTVLKFKLKIPNHKIILQKTKSQARRAEQFSGNFVVGPVSPFHVLPSLPSGPHFLRAILLENNDLRRRRPYGRAQDGPLSSPSVKRRSARAKLQAHFDVSQILLDTSTALPRMMDWYTSLAWAWRSQDEGRNSKDASLRFSQITNGRFTLFDKNLTRFSDKKHSHKIVIKYYIYKSKLK